MKRNYPQTHRFVCSSVTVTVQLNTLLIQYVYYIFDLLAILVRQKVMFITVYHILTVKLLSFKQ